MSEIKRDFVVGAVAVLASDMGSQYVPASVANTVNVGNLPVTKWAMAVAGAWGGERLMGTKAGIWRSVLLGFSALAAAELKDSFAPSIQFGVAGVDAARLLAGGLGIFIGGKAGLEKGA